ncbi:hypothetical protein [Aeromicrobium sp. 179-A 4D2 NHS]|uniref:hypothetical protein n=1 Tax=Aeromicrobium sp. 179-A 4D2 NHS TaxID=3142375 RepID=UPI0039A0AF56
MTTDSNGRKINVEKGKQGFQETAKGEPTRSELNPSNLFDKPGVRAMYALGNWDIAVSAGDEGPEEFSLITDFAEEIRDGDGPLADKARAALDQYDTAVVKADALDKDVDVDAQQEVIDVVREWYTDYTADEAAKVAADPVTVTAEELAATDADTEYLRSKIDDAPPIPDDWEITGDERRTIRDQIGFMNVLSISGGKVIPIKDGIELPVSYGYHVRVRLTPADDYTVERIFRRGGKEWVYGKRERVYADEVGQMAYYASCYNNDSGKEWTYMGR